MAQATVKCHLCGRSFQKPAHEVRQHNFAVWLMPAMERWPYGGIQPHRQPPQQTGRGGVLPKKDREKLSDKVPEGLPEILRQHEHRVAAEAMLGRPLRPGEVVHHRDGDKLNNDPMNLEVLPSQAEHTKTQRRDPQGRWCK